MRKIVILFLSLLFAIPAVTIAEGIVMVIYFVPRDRAIQQDIPAKISTQIKKFKHYMLTRWKHTVSVDPQLCYQRN